MLPSACTELGITLDLLAGRPLAAFDEAESLICACRNNEGRECLLTPETAEAWRAMTSAAARQGISLYIVSAYRSIARQAELIRSKLEAGHTITDILAILAPPGFSEHHTGRAIDIGAPDCPAADPMFAETPAYAWLQGRADEFGFTLSYPRDNSQGYVFEPWHWCYRR
ncbi:MAG: D-alanyl-D-alanine carboxypeptidase [Proteobacteria bacterium]|nr:D-alanyl-D-alanine carboxypeptidase [Pseudomonadota bacterium]